MNNFTEIIFAFIFIATGSQYDAGTNKKKKKKKKKKNVIFNEEDETLFASVTAES
jgi:hypothetical protein